MNDETLKEQIKDILRMPHNKKPERFSIATQIRNEQLGLIMNLVKQDRERAVKAGRIEELEKLITLNKTLYGVEAEMTRRANNRLAELSNPTQEKEGEVKLQPISLEDAIKAMGYLFRDLSYHSDGRWIARSGANTGRFMTSARTPRQAVFKLAEKIEQERRAKEKEKKSK